MKEKEEMEDKGKVMPKEAFQKQMKDWNEGRIKWDEPIVR